MVELPKVEVIDVEYLAEALISMLTKLLSIVFDNFLNHLNVVGNFSQSGAPA